MEYEYRDVDHMNKDMAAWQVPAMGDRRFGPQSPLVRSTTMFPQEVKDDLGVASPSEGP